ncbi:hypothetical protein GA0115255_102111, partial [Streptomyces sp. Ncost-T6T-2b]
MFYGLDWVATVPPTLALCREQYGDDSAIVFGWVLASHQVGAAVVAFLGGVARDVFGSYDVVWYAAGARVRDGGTDVAGDPPRPGVGGARRRPLNRRSPAVGRRTAEAPAQPLNRPNTP